MRLLLDTHIVIWALANDPNLPKKARELILDEGNDIYVSVVSLWEVVVKHALHRKDFPYSGKDFLDACERAGYCMLVLNEADVLAVESLKRDREAPPHKDPYDRLLLGQAKAEGLALVTHDSLIPDYNEPCVLSVK